MNTQYIILPTIRAKTIAMTGVIVTIGKVVPASPPANAQKGNAVWASLRGKKKNPCTAKAINAPERRMFSVHNNELNIETKRIYPIIPSSKIISRWSL